MMDIRSKSLRELAFQGMFGLERDSLHYRRTDDAVVVSTRPLDGEEWTPVPFTRVLSLKDGEFVREGVPHDREYIFDPEDYRLVYMNFARL